MLRSRWFLPLLLSAGVCTVLSLSGDGSAQPFGKGKGKGKGKEEPDSKSEIVRVDLSKLPPGLARVVKRYAVEEKGSDKKGGYGGSWRGRFGDFGKKGDFWKKGGFWKKDAEAKGKKAEPERGSPAALERRLDTLIRELEDLRKEVRRRR